MTLNGLRQQLKAKKLPTSGNKKTLAARLSAHFDRSNTSKRAKQTEGNPRQRETPQRKARQRERRTQQTDHNRQISPSLELRTTPHKKPRRRRSTATARQREQDSDSGEPSRRRRRPQTKSRQRGSPSESSRSRSRSPISTRRPSEGSKGRQRDPWRSSPHSHHTRTRHANSPTNSSDAEASDDLPYTLRLYQSSSSDSDSSTVRERPTSGPQHYSRRGHRPRQRRPSSRRKRRHHEHLRPSSSSSSTSTSTERVSYSDFSTDSSLDRRHRYPKRKHRRQTSRLSSRAKVKLKRLSVSCCPPLPERYAARIVRGEYVSFDKLTITAKKGKISPDKLPGSQGR